MVNTDINKKIEDIAIRFLKIKEEHEKRVSEFEEKRKKFYEIMDSYFSDIGQSSVKFDMQGPVMRSISIRKISKSSIEWDAKKLESRLDKDIVSRVIKKQYKVNDMPGLIKYLKTCGVNPIIFKKYITVEKTVDEKEIDNLGDTGRITVSQIDGCYKIKDSKPYFTVTSVSDERNG